MPMGYLSEPMGYLDPRAAAAQLPMILFLGDSQVVGEATTDTADPAFNVTVTQSTAVVLDHDFHYAQAANDPISYQPDITGGIRPYSIGGTPGMGPQITIGQVLTSAGHQCVLASFGIFGLAVKQTISTSNYPTQPPAGPNVWAQIVARTHGLETTWNAKTKVILVSDGGNDGANNTDASALGANMAQLLSDMQAAFPSAVIYWFRINADTVNAPGFVGMATAISQQTSFFAAHPSSVTPIITDDCALLSDHAHFSSDTCLVVGQRFAFRAMDALGFARPVAHTFPTALGFGPHFFSNGTITGNPHSWGGAQAKHMEILVCVTLTAAGTNNAITTPSGWTLIDSTTSTSGGSTIRAAFFQRNVDSSMLSANNGNTAPTAVAAANLDEFSEIFTFGSPTPGNTPSIEAHQLSVNNAFSTSLSATGVTTLGANRGVAIITVGFRTNPTANPITITGLNTTGNAVLKNGTRDSGRSNLCTIDVQTGGLASAGPTGNPSITSALNMIAITGVFAIAP